MSNEDILPSFSDREREILSMLIMGVTNKEISKRLNLNQKTISVYRHKILSRLKINNRIELLRLAAERQLIDMGWNMNDPGTTEKQE
jgi:DNA-binding NarL/FixJ family response regulator